MRVTFLKDMGSAVKAGAMVDVPDNVARALIDLGAAELSLHEIGGPGFDPGSEVMTPGPHPAAETPLHPEPRPGAGPDSPEAVGRGRLEQKEAGG